MRDAWKSRWGWRLGACVLAGGLLLMGVGTVVTQAGEGGDDRNQRNPFERILDKLDKILDAIKRGDGADENHTLRWDQVLPAAQRFVVLAAFHNAAVLDKETGLVWEQSPEATEYDWLGARFQCTKRITGGRKGWRLPSVHELASLVDPSAPAGPMLPVGHPFANVQPKAYWSATAVNHPNPGAWEVGFALGGVVDVDPVSLPGHVWCVRGGHNDGSLY